MQALEELFDEVGALNEMTDTSRLAAIRLATRGKVYDLGVAYDRASYKWPGHSPGELISYRTPEGVKRQRDLPGLVDDNADGLAWHSSALFISDNVGTQLDGLGHITTGPDNHWYNGFQEKDWGGNFGIRRADATTIPPIVARGVLIDVAAAKGLGSGMPIGAVIAKEHWMRWKPGSHGSTFGGNPVAAAAARATLDVIRDEKLMENATARGAQALTGLRAGLAGNAHVTDIRGIGLMIGVDFSSAEIAAEVEIEAFERGLLVLTCGDRGVRMSPPLVVNATEMETAVRIFSEAAAAVAARH